MYELVAASIFVLFLTMLPWCGPRPLSAIVLGAIALIWDFGAYVIWKSVGPTKVRFDLGLGSDWGWILFGVASVGIVAAAASLRAYARGEASTGRTLACGALAAFAFWS